MKRPWVAFAGLSLFLAVQSWQVVDNASLRHENDQLRRNLAIRKAIQDEIGRGMGWMQPEGKPRPR